MNKISFLKKKVGVWGLGITGKSLVRFLASQEAIVQVFDERDLQTEEIEFLTQKNILLYSKSNIAQFLDTSEFIMPSPRVDLSRFYDAYQDKWITELDLFSMLWHKPIIAITGTVGKTTVTALLHTLLENQKIETTMGGNIGIPCMDIIGKQISASYALLEVSNIQLRYTKQFAPTLAIWTNFYPNHLDWHQSLHDYFLSKFHIIRYQNDRQYALLPLYLYDQIKAYAPQQKNIHLFSIEKPPSIIIKKLSTQSCYYIENEMIYHYYQGSTQCLLDLSEIPQHIFKENILIAIAALDILQFPLARVPNIIETFILPKHRLEKIAVIRGVEFFNDSKSTIPASTNAAIDRLKNRRLHLIIGGLSKGIDRLSFIRELSTKKNIIHIYCFGAEATQLHAWCTDTQISASIYNTLKEIMDVCIANANPQDVVLFSPAGSSFDLFKNFEDRGEQFTELVRSLR